MRIVSAEFVTSAVNDKGYPPGGLSEVAFAGRSNVGKSSLINKLVNRRGLARTSGEPGRTQLINFFIINKTFHLVDLPGYGFARVPAQIRASWGKMIEGYLKERPYLRGVFMLVDIRREPSPLDLQMFGWLKTYHIPTVVVATKADKLSKNQTIKQLAVIKKGLPFTPDDRLITFSAQTGQGREDLLNILELWLN